jgi:hypothetical protein
VPRQPAAALEQVIGGERYAALRTAAARFRETLGRRTIWNVNSAAVGGGVAEMLRVLVGYAAGLDIPVRWTVIGGDPEFFSIIGECVALWHNLPALARARILLVTLPLDDVEENAARSTRSSAMPR